MSQIRIASIQHINIKITHNMSVDGYKFTLFTIWPLGSYDWGVGLLPYT